MLELRRRIQTDPASIAFAQLAEECRRVGSNEEAVAICRAGLARHPGYLSARVTLGRALIDLGHLDAAKAELDVVVAGVPDNLAAIRGLAEILQRRGQMQEALEYYKRALELAKHDRDLEATVERISQEVAPTPPPPQAGPQVSIEEIFNFDTLIDQLGLSPLVPENVPVGSPAITGPSATIDDMLTMSASAPVVEDFFGEIEGGPEALAEAPQTTLEAPVIETLAHETAASEAGSLESIELALDDADSLAVMERELRELEERRAQDEQRARLALAERRRHAMTCALETWLSAIVADRGRHSA